MLDQVLRGPGEEERAGLDESWRGVPTLGWSLKAQTGPGLGQELGEVLSDPFVPVLRISQPPCLSPVFPSLPYKSLLYKKVNEAQYRSHLANEMMMYHMKVSLHRASTLFLRAPGSPLAP